MKILKTIVPRYWYSLKLLLLLLFISCDSGPTDKIASLDEAIITLPKWYNGYKSAMSFVWDDNITNHEIKIGPMFRSFNFNCSFAIITGDLDDYFILKYKNLLSNNHELLSHSHTHAQLFQLSNEEILYEMSESKKTIIEIFDNVPISYVHPRNSTNEFYNNNLHDYYLYSRIYNPNQDSLNTIINIDSSHDFNGFKLISQENIDLENWCVIAGHGVDGSAWEPITSDDLYDFLDYLTESNNTWVEKFSNVALYNEVRKSVKSISIIDNQINLDISDLDLSKFTEYFEQIPLTVIIQYPNDLLKFVSPNIINYKYINNSYIVNIDLYKGSEIYIE